MGALGFSCILARLCSHSHNVCMPLERGAWCLGLVRAMSRVLVVGMVIQDVSRAVPVSVNQHRPQGRGALVDPLSSPDLGNIHAVGLVVRVVCWRLQTTEPVMSCGATTRGREQRSQVQVYTRPEGDSPNEFILHLVQRDLGRASGGARVCFERRVRVLLSKVVRHRAERLCLEGGLDELGRATDGVHWATFKYGLFYSYLEE